MNVFWTLYVFYLIIGPSWALWERQSEKSRRGMWDMPDIFSPMLRLLGVMFIALVIALVRMVMS